MDDLIYELAHSTPDAIRDDLAEARRTTATYRGIAMAALDQLYAATVEIERQRRLIAEMREERERYARDIFQRTPADE